MTNNPNRPPRRHFLRRFMRVGFLWKAGVVAVVLVVLFFLFHGGKETFSTGTTFVARQGPLDITVTEGGSIEARESQEIKCEVKGQTKILSIVDEGYIVTEQDVKEGKVLVRLDSADLEQKETQQEIEFQSATATYTDAKEQFEIQRKQNESDIKAAQLEAKFARMDFEKYLGKDLAVAILDRIGLNRGLEQKDIELDLAAELDALASLEQGAPDLAQPGTPPVPSNSTGKLDPAAPVGGAESAKPIAEQAVAKTQEAAPSSPVSEAGSGNLNVASAPAPASQNTGDAPPPASEKTGDGTPPATENAGRPGEGQPGEPATTPGPSPEELEADRAYLAARAAVDFTEYADVNKLGDGEAKQKLRELEDKLLLSQAELKLAEEKVTGTRRLREKDFVTQTELERDEMDLQSRQVSVESGVTAERLFIAYEFTKQAEKLLSDYEEALRKLERTKKLALSKLAQAHARLKSTEAQYRLQAKQRDDVKEDIAKCTIKAERPGMVVYAGSNDPWRRQEQRIEEGANVYENQAILTIPDMTEMIVEVKVHESAIKKIEKGQKAKVTLEAFPEEQLEGEVTKVGLLPDSSRRWMSPDLKVYNVTVDIQGDHADLKPGMSAKAEILIKELGDVVYVPIQAVVPSEAGRGCYVVDGLGGTRQVPVDTGEYNEEFIEVRNGINEGDRVLLHAPETGKLEGRTPAPGEEGKEGERPPAKDRPPEKSEAA